MCWNPFVVARLLTAVLLWAWVASPVVSQVQVSALSEGLEPRTQTTDVRCTRFASFADEPAVVVGMELEPGDLLASVSGGIDLELTCPQGSLMRFSGGFRVMINPPGENDCAVDFMSGNLDVIAQASTEVDAGGVVLGSEGTQYAVMLVRKGGEPDRRVAVYDGRLRVLKSSFKAPEVMETGTSVWVGKSGFSERRIEASELRRSAAVNARFDVSKAMARGETIEDPKAASRELQQLHYAVLKKPADTNLRVDLAKTQIRYKSNAQAVYHLNRGGVRTRQDLERHQIDANKLQLGTSQPQLNTGQTQLYQRPPSGQTGGTTSLRTSPPPTTTLVSDPFALLEAKRYEEARKLLEARGKETRPTSRDYCGLARAYTGLGDRDKARTYAKRAVYYAEQDGALTGDELRICQRLER